MLTKNYCLFFAFLFSTLTITAQEDTIMYTRENAKLLKASYEMNKGKKHDRIVQANIDLFFIIFKAYGKYETVNDSVLLTNPFMTKEMIIDQPEEKSVEKQDHEFQPAAMESKEDKPPLPKRNWQTAILDGTARFLAQRFKEELAAYYLNTFYGKLENKPIVKKMFPRTVVFLRVFANQVYNTDIAMLQVAAEEDLAFLPDNLINAMDEIETFKKNPLLQAGLKLNMSLYKDLSTGMGMADIINQLPAKIPANDTLQATYKSCLTVLRILSNSIRTERHAADQGPWTGLEMVDFYDPKLNGSYFYALLYEQLKSVSFEGSTMKEILGDGSTAAGRKAWKDWFTSFADLFQEIKSYNKVLEEEKDLPDSGVDFWNTLMRSARLVNRIYPIMQTAQNNKVMLPDAVVRVAANTDLLFQLVKRVKDKRYEQIIPNVIILFTSLDSNVQHAGIVPVLRYAAVIAQFATVRTSEDMKNLLQSVALPIGSASIKRKSKWNVSFNAYVGVAAGQEVLKQKSLTQNKTSIGLSAPLGIAISHQFGKNNNALDQKGKLIPSGTLYLSFMDIGNLVNVRLKSDTASIGQVAFSHFISLGAGYYLNFRNSPFTAGVSWTYVPGYRDALIENKWIYKADAVRIRFSLLVDIPLFNLYTKPND